MKKRQKAAWFVSGILCSAILASTVAPSLAAMVEQKLTVHTGVQVYVDDVKIDAGDTHGNPDAFIYNGTTYVAVAAVSKSLGENVIWDGDTKSVYIGEHEGNANYLLDVCPPYWAKGYEADIFYTMAGQKYANGFSLSSLSGCYALFNLNGNYDTLSFTVGHVDDDAYGGNYIYRIYLDGKLAYSVDVNKDMLPQRHEMDLSGAVQMKIVLECPRSSFCYAGAYAMADVQVF